jgi:hypothetical protein
MKRARRSPLLGGAAGILAALLPAAAPPLAWAHGLMIDYEILGEGPEGGADEVEIEVYYEPHEPVAGAQVEVVNVEDAPIARGETDAGGKLRFRFPRDGLGVRVVAAHAGHRDEILIPADSGRGKRTRDGGRRPLRLLIGILAILGLLEAVRRLLRGRGEKRGG